MTTQQLILSILSLASGTLAGLFKTPRYDEIDRRLEQWIEWTRKQHDGAYRTWQDAWQQYRYDQTPSHWRTPHSKPI